MSLEPAVAALIGLAVLGQHLSAGQWAAVGCVVAACLGAARSASPPPPPPPPRPDPSVPREMYVKAPLPRDVRHLSHPGVRKGTSAATRAGGVRGAGFWGDSAE